MTATDYTTGMNADLWLRKFAAWGYIGDAKKRTGRSGRITSLGSLKVQDDQLLMQPYFDYLTVWSETVNGLKNKQEAEIAEFETETNLIVEMGDATPQEIGLALDHTFGVPIIPGSALKGATSAYAHRLFKDEEKQVKLHWHDELFGTVKQAASVSFLTAMPVKARIQAKVMTPHHPDRSATQAPTDWDQPRPIPFVTVTGTFLVPLLGEAPVRKAALRVLQLALSSDGIGVGAKTSSGYGRLRLTRTAVAFRR